MAARFIVLLMLVAAAPAADSTIAVQTYGDGISEPVVIQPDHPVSSGDKLAQLRLLGAPGSDIVLGPGTVVRLQEHETPTGLSLVIALDAGRVQVSIDDKGRYHDVHVIGGALDARVTGTLFVVERTARDSDYVALVRGKLSVKLRQEVAEALAAGATDHADLESRQGVGGGPGGLGGIDSLTGRPQLGPHTSSIKEQGTGGGGGWDTDEAHDAIDADHTHPGDSIGEDISSHVADSVGHAVETQIGGEVVNQTLGAGGILGPPPGPPGP